jgi:hypothetical protein
MHAILKLFLAFGLASGAGFAAASGRVSCKDDQGTVEFTARTDKHNAVLTDLRIQSAGKTRIIAKTDIIRIRSNAVDFYLLLKVQSKTGPQDLELDTKYVKSNAERSLSKGTFLNKTESSDKLPVTCKFSH